MRANGLTVAAATLLLLIFTVTPGESRRKEDARVIVAVSTWTQLSLVTFTTSPFLTCNIAVQAVACRRRKLKRYKPSVGLLSDTPDSISSSLAEGSSFDKPIANDREKDGKIALTIWSSTTSTYTMTMTVVDTATTYSLSFACSVAGANMPPAC